MNTPAMRRVVARGGAGCATGFPALGSRRKRPVASEVRRGGDPRGGRWMLLQLSPIFCLLDALAFGAWILESVGAQGRWVPRGGE